MSTAKPLRAAIYARVSTGDQTTANQDLALKAAAERRGWVIVATYIDNGISGAKGRDERPGLDRLLKAAARGKFDVVMAWALDRIGRSLRDLLDTLAELEHCNTGLFLHQQQIDTTSPSGRMFFSIMGAVVEFERGMLRSCVIAGLARAKAQGKQLGRPRVSDHIEAQIRAKLLGGAGILKTAKTLGVGTGTVQRIKRSIQATAAS